MTSPPAGPVPASAPDPAGPAPESGTGPKNLSRWIFFALGVGSAVVGLLPWIATGMRLPLQSLGLDQALPYDQPLVLLPFSQYFILAIAALILVGSAIAGIVGRALSARRPRFGVLVLVAGVLLVQVTAAVQATMTTVQTLEETSRASLYSSVMVAVIVVSIVVGLGMLLLVAAAPRAGAIIGLSVPAILATSWLAVFVSPFLAYDSAGLLVALVLLVFRWLPTVLVGLAIAWGGFRTGGRIAAAAASLLVLWIGPALITGITNSTGSRVLLMESPAEIITYTLQVFRAASTQPALVIPPLVVALVIGVVGGIGYDRIRRRRALNSSPTLD